MTQTFQKIKTAVPETAKPVLNQLLNRAPQAIAPSFDHDARSRRCTLIPRIACITALQQSQESFRNINKSAQTALANPRKGPKRSQEDHQQPPVLIRYSSWTQIL